MGNPKKLWIPTEKLDENVKRMAWLLFLECWKGDESTDQWTEEVTKGTYEDCIRVAKIIRDLNNPKQQEMELDVTPD
jgi:hypothetical protein